MSGGARSVLLAFALALGLYIAYELRKPLLLIYISIVFAVVLSPGVERVQGMRLGNWRPSRGISILIILGGVLFLVFLFFYFALPPIARDIQALAKEWPKHQRKLSGWISELPFGASLNLELLERHAGSLIGGISGFLTDVVSLVFTFATVLVLMAYMILDGDRSFRWAMRLFPPGSRPRLQSALRRGARRMSSWIVGQGLLMLILGSSSAMVLGLLGIRYFYVLAVLAGIANIIPLVGPILTVIVASLVAVIDSLGKLAGVLIFFFAYQQVENAYLTPRIMQAQVKLSPVAVLVALMLGGGLAGVLGALVAVPTAALVSVLVDEYLAYRDERISEIRGAKP